ncbi:Uncharacterised protein [BD1-7 clade bacterium]|uniref:Porin n=1 Tax=BD1-7 clade bacterium TaxID=2029982 RepID=A0A5S9N2Q3_9GAMM|nr:Uncharacterised protein [BD1-7 clade bacterium]
MTNIRAKQKCLALAVSMGAADVWSAEEADLQTQVDQLQEQVEALREEQKIVRTMMDASTRPISDRPNFGIDAPVEGWVVARDKSFQLIIGGYARVDLLYTPRGVGDEESWTPATIPVRSSLDGKYYLNTSDDFVETSNQFRFNVQQTRLNIESRTFTDAGELKVFIETDFWGSGQLRLRHAYAEFKDWKIGNVDGNWLVGQTWSSFIVTSSWVEVLDFQGPNSNSTLRLPMLRWRQFVSDHFIYTLSLEQNPYDTNATDVYVDGRRAEPKALTGTFPMLVAAFVFGDDRTNVQVSAAYAHIRADVEFEQPPQDPIRREEQINGTAINVGGSIGLTEVDSLKYYFVYSDGLGRVIADLNSGFAQGVFGFDQQARVTQLASWGVQMGYEHDWNSSMRSAFVYGYVDVNNAPLQNPMSFHSSEYGTANFIWSPVDEMMVGVEFQYGMRENLNGDNDDATRVQFATQYNF